MYMHTEFDSFSTLDEFTQIKADQNKLEWLLLQVVKMAPNLHTFFIPYNDDHAHVVTSPIHFIIRKNKYMSVKQRKNI